MLIETQSQEAKPNKKSEDLSSPRNFNQKWVQDVDESDLNPERKSKAKKARSLQKQSFIEEVEQDEVLHRNCCASFKTIATYLRSE